MIGFVLSCIFITIAAIFKAVMDTLQFHFYISVFNCKNPNIRYWLNPDVSWKLKYKNKDVNQGPAFFGSTTFLVWLTNGWHLFQMLFLTCIFLSIVFYTPIMNLIFAFLILKINFDLVFELFFSKIFKKTKK